MLPSVFFGSIRRLALCSMKLPSKESHNRHGIASVHLNLLFLTSRSIVDIACARALGGKYSTKIPSVGYKIYSPKYKLYIPRINSQVFFPHAHSRSPLISSTLPPRSLSARRRIPVESRAFRHEKSDRALRKKCLSAELLICVLYTRLSHCSLFLSLPRYAARLINNTYLTNSPSRPAAPAPVGAWPPFENLAAAGTAYFQHVIFHSYHAAVVDRNEIPLMKREPIAQCYAPDRRDFASALFGEYLRNV